MYLKATASYTDGEDESPDALKWTSVNAGGWQTPRTESRRISTDHGSMTPKAMQDEGRERESVAENTDSGCC